MKTKKLNLPIVNAFVFLAVLSLSLWNFSRPSQADSTIPALPQVPPGAEVAILAGGCFWCMQQPFDTLPGVIATTVGFSGGSESNPKYKQVSSGATSHVEAIHIIFDPKKISYKELLTVFWQNIDPTQRNGQFADRGAQYRTVIFYLGEEQRKVAYASKSALASSKKFPKPIVTEISPAGEFYPAEEGHQKYYKKNPSHYKAYKIGSGRAGFIKKNWGS